MASAWGFSFGVAWGESWGEVDVTPTFRDAAPGRARIGLSPATADTGRLGATIANDSARIGQTVASGTARRLGRTSV